jgi:tetratricopeptide (TPR) repeat protein
MIFLMFNMPSLLRKKWHDRKLMQTNKKLLIVLAELLMGNRKKSINLTNKLVADLKGENQEVINLIRAEAEEGFDKKIQYLRALLDKKYYSIYAAKKLAEIFYQNAHYKQAEECATKAFNEDDTDTELMLTLMRVYAALGSWHKLAFIISKLKRANVQLLEERSEEVASFYYAASKATLQSGDDEKALEYLESALEFYPGYVEALNLFMELSVNAKNTTNLLKVLRVAFISKPCFEIARMYADTSRSSAEAIYGTLAGMASTSKYPDLFLALSAYLGLSNKAKSANEARPNSDENIANLDGLGTRREE